MKTINLALQGGGSHGAYTWGVLDRLLEQEDLDIVGISGASAGAMNAVALAQGLSDGGPEHARALLRTYWEAVSKAAKNSPIQRTWWDKMGGNWSLEHSPGFIMSQFVQQMVSPYQFNPLDINPLADLVRETFDFEVINNADKGPKLFLSATNVRTGRAKVFRQPDISVETVMASACLPQMFKAVEIDGEAYWDGGYMGNPPIFPLIDETDALNYMIIQVNPLVREDIPKTPYEIQNRLNEITFNASLHKELRSIGFLWELIKHEGIERSAYREATLHRIHAEKQMARLSVSSKMNAEKKFLDYLFDMGRSSAEAWIKEHYDDLGKRSTWFPKEIFEESRRPAHLAEGVGRNSKS